VSGLLEPLEELELARSVTTGQEQNQK